VRGISSLLILHEIMLEVQKLRGPGCKELPKPCEFFDIIGGTSTGGLIAIMVGRLRMSTEDAIQKYDVFAEQIFQKDNKRILEIRGKFGENTLKDAIEKIVSDVGLGDTMRDPVRHDKGKSFGIQILCLLFMVTMLMCMCSMYHACQRAGRATKNTLI
jgi:hypothetical protein